MPNYIHLIYTHPDLVCVCGKKELLDELDRVLLNDSPSTQLLSYDMMFKLGDFYISLLAFKHVMFKMLYQLVFLSMKENFNLHMNSFLLSAVNICHLFKKLPSL